MRAFDVRVLTAVNEVRPEDWDGLLSPRSTPFMRHAWLHALERSASVSAR
ncbi:MAG: GNAT family N-acetyltransferase, partial [Deltaproteobacteria bacterium]